MLPPEVTQFLRGHYRRPFMESVETFKARFPQRRASVDLPVLLNSGE